MEDPKVITYTITNIDDIDDVAFLATHALFSDCRLVVTATNGDDRSLIFKARRDGEKYRVVEYTRRASGLYPNPEAAVKAGLSAARGLFKFR